jgi:hypothetical protein
MEEKLEELVDYLSNTTKPKIPRYQVTVDLNMKITELDKLIDLAYENDVGIMLFYCDGSSIIYLALVETYQKLMDKKEGENV